MAQSEEMPLRKKRGKAKHKPDYDFSDICNYYEERHGKLPVTRKEFGLILKEFHEHVIDEIVLKGFIFNMPGNLGTISLTYRYPTTIVDEEYKIIKTDMPIDYPATMELWKRSKVARERRQHVYLNNSETDGKIYNFRYKPTGVITQTYNPAYKLLLVRRLKRTKLVAAIREGKLKCL